MILVLRSEMAEGVGSLFVGLRGSILPLPLLLVIAVFLLFGHNMIGLDWVGLDETKTTVRCDETRWSTTKYDPTRRISHHRNLFLDFYYFFWRLWRMEGQS